MTDITDYDDLQFQAHIRVYEARLRKDAFRCRAEQNALLSHPVTPYVRNLPVQSAEVPMYPAISYHQSATVDQVGDIRPSSTGTHQGITDTSQLPDPVVSGNQPHAIESRASCNRMDPDAVDRFLQSPKHFIHWSLPAHDLTRPIRKGCGFIRATDGTFVYTACCNDDDHYLRAKRRHCWSLHCPDCMNDTALRNGSRAQDRFDKYINLVRKQTGKEPQVSHFVVSPPQELARTVIQTYEGYDSLTRYIESQLVLCGGIGGDMVFHPWRQRHDMWELSPHFHCLLFGFIDTRRFLRDNPGWIIKKVHARQRIRSVKHTMGYLQTHCGLARIEVNPDSVDWDLRVLAHFIPGLITGNDTGFTDRDYDDMEKGRGRMVGDLSDMDWTEWTSEALTADLHHRYWGELSPKRIVRVDNHREYRIRTCDECGSLLRTYDGLSDHSGDYVRYIVDNPVMCFAQHAGAVKAFFLRYKSELHDGTVSVLDLARMVPVAVCAAEYRPDNGDLLMDGPFAEPDELFLERQRRATQGSD